MIRIAPSILSADMCNLESQIRIALDAGADMVHVDVMDGHFVPNITIGLPVVRSLRSHFECPIDVHLMISDPETYAPLFAKAGADIVSVHTEATPHLDRVLSSIREAGAYPAIVLNPSTPPESIEWALDACDMVLIMSVNPGFGGQKFIPRSIEKVRKLRALIDARGLKVDIEIDGGIVPPNAAALVSAGADILVAGSAIFSDNDGDVTGNVKKLKVEAMRGLPRKG
jgi:ribulose-phosphate 3-epimerase